MKRLAVLGLVVLAMLAVTAVSAGVHRDIPQTNDFGLLSGVLELFVVPVGGIVASVYLARRRDNARGVLGVGLYSLIIGTIFITVFSFWLPEDDIILATAFLGALLAMVGTALAIASALTVRGRPTAMSQTVGWLCGVVAFLAAMPRFMPGVVLLAGNPGGMIGTAVLPNLHVIVLVLVVAAVGLHTRHRGQMLLQPLLLSAAATILTILVLVARGPGDWASGSDTLKLYSFPLIVMGIAISLAIVQVTAPGRSLPRGRPGNTSA
jgi:hypothetical protein